MIVIVKSNKEELHRFFALLANTKSEATSFAPHDWTTSPTCVRRVETRISRLEYAKAASHGLLEEDGARLLILRRYLLGERT